MALLHSLSEAAKAWPLLLPIFHLIVFGRSAKSDRQYSALALLLALFLLLPFALRALLPLPSKWLYPLWINLLPTVMLAASLPFLLRARRHQGVWRFSDGSLLWIYFVLSNALQHAAFAAVGAAVWLLPDWLKPYLLPLLAQQYLASPVFWAVGQQLIAVFLWLDGRISRRNPRQFTGAQLAAALLFAMLLHGAYCVQDVAKIAVP